jgi:hypothetical protein
MSEGAKEEERAEGALILKEGKGERGMEAYPASGEQR